jgi:DNA-binding transcriptional LysR family regulator
VPFVIAASEEYLQRCGVPQFPEDLAQHDSVMVGTGQSWHFTGPHGNLEIPARVVLRFGSMSVAVAHAVCAGIGLAPLPRTMFEDPMFKHALYPVLTKYPLRHPQLYAIYVSRKHLPLKIRTFIDQLIEFTHIPRSWDALVTDDLKRSIKATQAVSLAVAD